MNEDEEKLKKLQKQNEQMEKFVDGVLKYELSIVIGLLLIVFLQYMGVTGISILFVLGMSVLSVFYLLKSVTIVLKGIDQFEIFWLKFSWANSFLGLVAVLFGLMHWKGQEALLNMSFFSLMGFFVLLIIAHFKGIREAIRQDHRSSLIRNGILAVIVGFFWLRMGGWLDF